MRGWNEELGKGKSLTPEMFDWVGTRGRGKGQLDMGLLEKAERFNHLEPMLMENTTAKRIAKFAKTTLDHLAESIMALEDRKYDDDGQYAQGCIDTKRNILKLLETEKA